MVHLWFIFFSLLLQGHHLKLGNFIWESREQTGEREAQGVRSLADKKRSPANTSERQEREVRKNERRLFGCASQLCLIVLVSLVVTQLGVYPGWLAIAFCLSKSSSCIVDVSNDHTRNHTRIPNNWESRKISCCWRTDWMDALLHQQKSTNHLALWAVFFLLADSSPSICFVCLLGFASIHLAPQAKVWIKAFDRNDYDRDGNILFTASESLAIGCYL